MIPRHYGGLNIYMPNTEKPGLIAPVLRPSNELFPLVDQFVQRDAHLITDENRSYHKIGQQYADHSCVKHSMNEFVRGAVHNNMAESFGSTLERAKQGVFHNMSHQHLPRYLPGLHI